MIGAQNASSISRDHNDGITQGISKYPEEIPEGVRFEKA
jgi:hypothetical protein